MKRILTVALSLFMLLTMSSMALAETAEPINLVYYYAGNGLQQDTVLVNDHINELLKTTPGLENVNVTLMPMIPGEYNQKLTLAMTAGEQVDIVSLYKAHNNYYDEFSKGTYISLDDFMNQIPDTVAELPEWILNYGKMNGQQYFIPTYQQNGNMYKFFIPTEYLPYLADGTKDGAREIFCRGNYEEIFEMLTTFTRKVQAAYPERTIYADSFASMLEQQEMNHSFDVIETSLPRPVEIDSETLKVSEFYSTDAMKLALKATAQNFEDGLMPEDIMTMKLTDYNGKSMLNTVAFAWTTGSGVGTEEQLEETMLVNYGFPTTVIEMSPTYFVGMNYAAGGNCITSTCKNPEAAIKFIDLLCSKKGAEVYNTLVYGIEGVHYEKIDDTHIKTFEYDGSQGGVKTKYSTWKWNIGNTFNAYLNQGCVDGTNEFILNVMHGSQAKVSKLIGLTWDTSVVESELAQMKAIQKEYCKGLTYGVMGSDWEAYFNEYVAKLESADYQKVIDQLQSQVDHFMAGK